MRSAVVVGAGFGGLAAAGGLARTGWRVTLLERCDRLRAEPTALLLWPGGVRALRALRLDAGLDAITTPVPDLGVRRPDGQWLVQPGASPRWGPPLLVHAQDLHDALVAGLGDQVEIHTGVRVRRAGAVGSDRPAVTDGRTSWEADLVVVADGVDSALRATVAPSVGVVSAGATAWRAVIPWYRASRLLASLPPDLVVGGQTHGSGGYRFFAASLGERSATGTSGRGGLYWCATAPGAPRPEPPETQLALLRRWFTGWHAPIGDLLAATEPDDLVQQELRTLRPVPHRYGVPAGSGGFALLGDAGHAIADHLGQGACLAMEDAATLVAAVRDATPGAALAAAIASFDRARRPRLAEVRRRSGRLGSGGLLAGLGVVQARRRDRAAAAAAAWEPPE